MTPWRVLVMTTTLLVQVAAARPNVLFIANDDLRPMIHDFPGSAYPWMVTPHLDAFMKDALTLTNSHVQQAVCSPSRTSLLWGRRPDTTHVWDLYDYAREVGCASCLTIPQLFKEANYFSVGVGKIFHDGHASGGMDPPSWTDVNGTTTGKNYFIGYDGGPGMCQSEGTSPTSWHMVDENVTGLCMDSQVREKGLEWLHKLGERYEASGQNFFLAVGFRKPHLPFVAPKEFFDLYPPNATKLAPNPFAPAYMPEIAYASYELQNYPDVKALGFRGQINVTLVDWKALDLVRAYQAALSYTDHNIGALLTALRNQPKLWQSTIVAFWGDHGFKLGHHGAWAKHTNFQEDTLSPVMLRLPGVTDGKGLVSGALVEHVDMMATLVDAAGIAPVPICPSHEPWKVSRCTEGVSFLPVVYSPARRWKNASYSQYPRPGAFGRQMMGYSMRFADARFTAWVLFNATSNSTAWSMDDPRCGFELYNLTDDPLENLNLAYREDMTQRVATHFTQLKAGWRATLQEVTMVEDA